MQQHGEMTYAMTNSPISYNFNFNEILSQIYILETSSNLPTHQLGSLFSPQRIPATMINKGLLYGFFYRKTRKPDVFRKSDEGASRHHVRRSDQTDSSPARHLTSIGRTVTRCLSGNMGNSPIT